MTDTSLLIVLAKLQHLFAMPTDVERFVIVHELCLELLDRAEAAEAERDALQARAEIAETRLQVSIDIHGRKVWQAAVMVAKANAERDALQAENLRLRAVLQSIADNTCCDGCREAALVAREGLKAKP
jgi:hypothetical protein